MALTGTVTEDWTGQTAAPGNPDTGRWTVDYEGVSTRLDVHAGGTPSGYLIYTLAAAATNGWRYTVDGPWATTKQKITAHMGGWGSGHASGEGFSIGLKVTYPGPGNRWKGYFCDYAYNPTRTPAHGVGSLRFSKSNGLGFWGWQYNTEIAFTTGVVPGYPSTVSFEAYPNGDLIAYLDGNKVLEANDTTYASELGYPFLGIHDPSVSTTGGDLYIEKLVFTDEFGDAGLKGTSFIKGQMAGGWNRNVGHP